MIANAEHTLTPHYIKIAQTMAAFCNMIIRDVSTLYLSDRKPAQLRVNQLFVDIVKIILI